MSAIQAAHLGDILKEYDLSVRTKVVAYNDTGDKVELDIKRVTLDIEREILQLDTTD